MKIVIFGLSITSSWGNGHATVYRGLVRELDRRGHDVLFLERSVPWYAQNRDLPKPPYGQVRLYESLAELKLRFSSDVRAADCVIVGSYVPEGVSVGRWITGGAARGMTAFYDIDTPVTVSKIENGECDYLSQELIKSYDVYLSFTGGPLLERIGSELGARRTHAYYCSVDPEIYRPEPVEKKWDLGYLGTFSKDRQPVLDRLLLAPASMWAQGRFVVAGPSYPEGVVWPPNVHRIEHLPPPEHQMFYNAQRFTLNATRAEMVRAGWSPSVRLFEAAACGTPIISDFWQGLEAFFEPGQEILVARSAADTLRFLREMPEQMARQIAERARARVLAAHTAAHRAAELEDLVSERKPAAPALEGAAS